MRRWKVTRSGWLRRGRSWRGIIASGRGILIRSVAGAPESFLVPPKYTSRFRWQLLTASQKERKKNCDNYSTRYGCRFLANPRNTVPGSFSLARSCDQIYIQIARRSRLREQVNVILIEVVREQAVIQLQLWAAGPDRTLDHRSQNTSLSPLWVGTIAAPIPAALSVLRLK